MLITLDEAQKSIDRIAEVLHRKGIVAIPTDTIYGLAADGTDASTVQKLTDLKQRKDKPFAYFMKRGDMERYAVVTKGKIIDFFLPGPLTIILRRRADTMLPMVGEKIGIRTPNHNFVLRLLQVYPHPLCVSSANISGEPHLISPYDIVEHLTAVDLVIDAGMLYATPSTVIDLVPTPPVVMRKGTVPILAIEKVYGRRVMLDSALRFNVLFVCSGNTCRSPMAEGIFRTMVEGTCCEVRSAGTTAMAGLPAAQNAKEVVKEHGGSIDGHETRPLDRETIDWADLILVMEYKHYVATLEINPDAVVKTFLLREYRRRTRYTEVPDPVGQDITAYRRAAAKMVPVLKTLARGVAARFKGKERP